ncbi:hypothetical protein H7347_00195 [Corynebacterium sp. zg-331]|uniref:hypothetical protein n=1 Tax=unclassified Corynebacterium TaxID=2624378 RepID=UPI00128BAABC|nr:MULTISPECIES: hypothetical protein [unclassified Corynebacterium]MBC3185017.1 hypothetical protein [Corynebacterium sp. zg-331]MPV51517.1 hypothetical protein [Corynebacterium sp. zg331]
MRETLRIRAGAPGLESLLARAVGLDASALARLRSTPDGHHVDVFVTTPFEVVAARRVEGQASREGAVVGAHDLYGAVAARSSARDIGVARDPSWPGALPPAEGFRLLDEVPVSVVRGLADQGQALARQFSGPLGPPASLLNQPVLEVSGEEGSSVAVPMRMIFTCTALGLIPGFATPVEVPRHLRVSALGRWVRVDAPFGTVYHSTRLSLF